MKKIIPFLFLFLLFSNFPFFLTKIVAQTGVIAFNGNKIIYVDTINEVGNTNFATGDILYQGEGIVLYDEDVPSTYPGRSDGACIDVEGTTHTVSRCADFTIPDSHPSGYVVSYPWVNYRNVGGCLPATFNSTLSDSKGNPIAEPYFVKAGETYTFCMEATMAREECTINYSCMTPYLVKTNYKIEHYLKKDNSTDLLSTLPGNSSKDYFAVAADGSDVSTFRVKPLDENQVGPIPNLKLRMKADPNGSSEFVYGFFEEPERETEYIEIVYNHPALLPLSTNKEYIEYEVELFIDGNQEVTVLETLKLRVYRAPVVLIHGYLIDNTSFGQMKFFLANSSYYNDNLVTRANYPNASTKAFQESSLVIPDAIDIAINSLKDESIAVGKVDIIGHSTGGVLARFYLQGSSYNEDVFRLITLNTPHSGTQLANDIYSFSENLLGAFHYMDLLENVNIVSSSVTNDLRINSSAMEKLNINNLNNEIVPSHTVATHQSYVEPLLDQLKDGPKLIIGVLIASWLGGEFYLNDLYNSETHDFIVPLSSQQGGLSGFATTVISNQWHLSTKSQPIMDKMLSLLRESSESPSFTKSGFRPVTLRYDNSLRNINSQPQVTNSIINSNSSINIISPQKNSSIEPGETFNINVVGNDITEIFTLIESNKDSIDFIRNENSSINFEYTVGQYSGERKIIVIGRTSDGTIVIDSTKIYVCPSDLVLNDEIANDNYQVANTIQANGFLEDATQANLTAGNSITFTNGFHAQKGTSLLATIEDCGDGTTPPTNITIDGNFDDWANVPTISTNGSSGLNLLKAYDDCEAIYVYADGNLDAHFQLFIDSDFNTTGANEFIRNYPNTGINFMMEDAYPYEYTGTGEDWSWNQTSLDTEPFEINGNKLEMMIPKNIIPNLGANINLGFIILNNDWNISGKLPDADAGAAYAGRICDNLNNAEYPLLNTTKINQQQKDVIIDVFPNPFRQTTSIQLTLSNKQHIDISLYDINGRAIKKVANGLMNEGRSNLTLDAPDLLAGFYYLHLRSATETIIKKIVVGQF